MTEPSSQPTTTFEGIASLIGQKAALNLCEQHGGETIYIRKNIESESTRQHFLTFFGEEGSAKLIEAFGGQRCYVPKAPPALLESRGKKIVSRRQAGESCADLARDYLLTPRYVALIYQRATTMRATEGVNHAN